MKRRAFSLLLSLTLLLSLALPATTAYAEEDSSNKGMEISKTATANKDGSYTITLEAYATGAKVISDISKDVPTDIILVLDQSGSMADPIGTVSFAQYEDEYDRRGNVSTYHTRNQDYYEYRHNGGSGNLWHKLDDDSYVSVSVNRQEQVGYTEITNGLNESSHNGRYTNIYNNRNNLYAKVNGEYVSVSVTRSGRKTYTYTYTLPDGIEIASSQGATTTPTIRGTDDNKLYLASIDDTQTVYTYTYTDSNNNVKNIETSTGATTVFSPTLYERVTNPNGGGSRLAAIQAAVTNFANAVTAKAKGADGLYGTDDDINHRIAVVGFAHGHEAYDGGWIYEDIPAYTNTEVFVGSSQYQYGTSASAQYGNAFQNMNTQTGCDNVIASKNALAANGGTYTNLGLEMANGIFGANPISAGTQRNRVVIVFTDGIPGESGYDGTVAESAISQATTAKNTYGATVYTIGVFSGADASSAGSLNTDSDADKGNYFLQRVSSNTQYPQSPSYYLSAADAGSLNSIFQQISSNIETGGTTSTLTSDAVVKDIISPQFTLPEGATTSSITLETYRCTGKNGSDYTWSKNTDAMGATATISGNQVNVTGFNFSENYVGTVTENGKTTYRGHKLVISFKVQPKAGFLGGNNVYTNTSAGVYENVNATTPVLEFNRPQVNVPIDSVTVKPEDKNVYLLSDVELDALKNGATVTVGKVPLNLTADNYGLEAWQNEYVDITVEIKDKDGKVISTDLSALTDDATYTVAVTVTPKPADANSDGTPATKKSGSKEANIKVYKPELTYKDSEVFYGDDVPTDFDTNNRIAPTKWKHGDDVAVPDNMVGAAPALTITYTPDSNKIDDNKIASTEDIQVKATVKINDTDVTGSTTFLHTACNPACSWKETSQGGSPAFLLHVKTATLKITKEGADGNKNEGFIFEVKGPNNLTFRVSVKDNGTVKITGLPLGTYIVTEEEGWSWRYTAEDPGSAELTEDKPEGTVIIQNKKEKPYLLDGSAYAQNNSVRPAAGN